MTGIMMYGWIFGNNFIAARYLAFYPQKFSE